MRRRADGARWIRPREEMEKGRTAEGKAWRQAGETMEKRKRVEGHVEDGLRRG
jgi:hypothetical protein